LEAEKKLPSIARLYPQELESIPAMWEGSCTEELFEAISKTYCTLVGLGARFVYAFQRF
jgi:hypothetical protein